MSAHVGRERRDPGSFFDAEAVRYDASYDSDDWAGRFLRARLDAVLQALGDGPGLVLDAGMGGGRLVAELDARGWTATGVDNSSRMVELALERLPQLAGRLLKADLEALPFPDESFDAVVATGALEYVGDLDRGLRELVRLLRPGGKAVLSFPNHRSPRSLWRRVALYPAARLIKRVLPLRRSAPLRSSDPVMPRNFERALEGAGLRNVARRPIAPRGVGQSRLAGLIAPQFVFRAVK
jgi:SAM-dependent methyltransferase